MSFEIQEIGCIHNQLTCHHFSQVVHHTAHPPTDQAWNQSDLQTRTAFLAAIPSNISTHKIHLPTYLTVPRLTGCFSTLTSHLKKKDKMKWTWCRSWINSIDFSHWSWPTAHRDSCCHFFFLLLFPLLLLFHMLFLLRINIFELSYFHFLFECSQRFCHQVIKIRGNK